MVGCGSGRMWLTRCGAACGCDGERMWLCCGSGGCVGGGRVPLPPHRAGVWRRCGGDGRQAAAVTAAATVG